MGYTRTNLTGTIRASDFNETRLALVERLEISGVDGSSLPAAASQGDVIRAYSVALILDLIEDLAESGLFLVAHSGGTKLDADHYDSLSIDGSSGNRYTSLAQVLTAIGSSYTAWPRWYGDRPYSLSTPTGSGTTAVKDVCIGALLELARSVLSALVWTYRSASWITPAEHDVSHFKFHGYETSRADAYDIAAGNYATGWPNGLGTVGITRGCVSKGYTYEAYGLGWACDLTAQRTHQEASVDLYGLPTESYDYASTVRWRAFCETPTDGTGGNEFDDNGDTGVNEDAWGTFGTDSSLTGQVRYSSMRQGGTSQPTLSTGPQSNANSYVRGYTVSDDCEVILQWEDGFDYP